MRREGAGKLWTGWKRMLYPRRSGRERTFPPRTGIDGPSGADAQVAQLVEQRTENPRVGGSIPPLGTISFFPIFMSPNSLNGIVILAVR